jgi:DNA-binding NtrC family response regulator
MDNAKLLVVDDEESMCQFMQIFLSKEGYSVTATADPTEAVSKIEKEDYDLLIADLMMPEMSGLELLSRAKGIDPGLNVIVMTAFASVDSAIEALKKGASDYVTKPFKVEEIKIAIRKTLDQKKIVREVASLKRQLKKEFLFDNFIGTSPQILEMRKLAERVAATDSTVLIRGESGTGKELVARAIHNHSLRSGKPFVSINCAALPETLLESELFGHTRGAFTGAVKDKEGLIKVADGGTFLLDEVGETSPAIQVKLLRVLEEKEITPLGSTRPVPVDVRLIASTNAELEQDVKSGKFRADLYYRLNVIPIQIPPLRERKEDIKLLVNYFLKRLSEREKAKLKGISEPAMKVLTAYPWAGNVRELENVIEQAYLLCKKDELEPEDLPERVKLETSPPLVEAAHQPTPTLEEVEKAYIFWTLEKTGWQKSKAAQILGIDASTLYRKIERYQFREK